MIEVSLVVLRAENLEKTREFYEQIGLNFVEEQHGTGPVHYACELNGMVIEIYSGKPGSAPERTQAGAVMLGLRVEAVENLVQQLEQAGHTIITPPKASPWGKRAVISDPDGRAIELSSQ